MKKRVWITAGGTGSAWHICEIAKKYYGDELELFVSDTNDANLVAASTLADHFFSVPPVRADGYAETMYRLLADNKIDLVVPLIPWEQPFFSPDNEEFKRYGIRTLAPYKKTAELLNDKESLEQFCRDLNVPAIRSYQLQEWQQGKIPQGAKLFLKKRDGFGSMGTKIVSVEELAQQDFAENVVQEYCGGEGGIQEITVEAFCSGDVLRTAARRRIESKSGVCTKAEMVKVPQAEAAIKKLTEALPFPKMFNVQFIYHEGVWKLMDVNLRLAAGSGLSCAAGFQLVRAVLADFLGQDVREEWFAVDETIQSVLRVYQEIVVR